MREKLPCHVEGSFGCAEMESCLNSMGVSADVNWYNIVDSKLTCPL